MRLVPASLFEHKPESGSHDAREMWARDQEGRTPVFIP
jgi:hypothetical protein